MSEYQQWRRAVFVRDHFTCQECHKIGGVLNAHHKIEFATILYIFKITIVEEALDSGMLWSISNGITYCKKCHEKYHKEQFYEELYDCVYGDNL